MRWWALAVVLSRLYAAMALLALILGAEAVTGSLADGALLVGLASGGFALAAPWRGRRLDRGDLRRGLRRDSLWAAVAMFALFWALVAAAPFWLLVILSVLIGAIPSGVEGGIRTLLPAVAPGNRLAQANAMEATLGELTFLLGPALAALIAMTLGPTAIMASMAVASAACGLVTLRLPDRVEEDAGPARDGERSDPAGGLSSALIGVWRFGRARPVFALAIAVGATFGLYETALPGQLVSVGQPAASAGWVLTLAFAMSAGAGLVVSLASPDDADRARALAVPQACALLLVLGLGCVASAAGPTPLLWLAAMAIGATLAPLYAMGSLSLQVTIPPARQSEGFAMFIAAQEIGSAIGNLLTSFLLERIGAATLFVIAGTVVWICAALLLSHLVRRHSDRT